MEGKIKYTFSAKVWRFSSPNGWYFVSLPLELSEEIRLSLKEQEEGWGRLKSIVKIGNSKWKTSLWFDTKFQSYILPLKQEIRKQENLEENLIYIIEVWI